MSIEERYRYMGAVPPAALMAEKKIDYDHLNLTGAVKRAVRKMIKIHDRALCSSLVLLKRFGVC